MSNWWNDFTSTVTDLGSNALDAAGDYFTTGTTGNTTLDLLLGSGLGSVANRLNILPSADPNVFRPMLGYQGKIPDYKFVRERVPIDPDRVGGSKGQRYFTDAQFAQVSDDIESKKPPTVQEAQKTATAQRAALAQRNLMERPTMAQGGIAKLAQGRYLSGSTDGMADVVPARIDGGQEARLSDGEFVIPADVVSHLGNGNSDAGAKQLHNMMDGVRQARTGRKAQGIEINPDKFMPKMASGGIARFNTGNTVNTGTDNTVTDTDLPMPDPSGSSDTNEAPVNMNLGTESSLSSYAGPYVTDMLGRGVALADMPYEAYEGALTADIDPLQEKAFTGIGGLQSNVADMGVKTFDAAAAQQYMNPYVQAALQPQIDEAARLAEIERQKTAGRLTRAGAFGGSRQAIMESEGLRNLADLQSKITGEGYRDAYDKALSQFNKEQEARNKFGFDVLGGQAKAGEAKRNIEQQRIAGDLAQFEEERDFPYKQVQYMQSLLQGLPLEAQSTVYSTPSDLASSLATGQSLRDLFTQSGLGYLFDQLGGESRVDVGEAMGIPSDQLVIQDPNEEDDFIVD